MNGVHETGGFVKVAVAADVVAACGRWGASGVGGAGSSSVEVEGVGSVGEAAITAVAIVETGG